MSTVRTIADLTAYLERFGSDTPLDARVRAAIATWLREPFAHLVDAATRAIEDGHWAAAEARIEELRAAAGDDPAVTELTTTLALMRTDRDPAPDEETP